MAVEWKKKGRKSYYYKFKKRFMVVLLIPMITTIFMFFLAQNTIKEQILVLSSNMLNQFFQYVDSAVDKARDNCLSIISDTDFQQYSRNIVEEPERNTYSALKVQEKLNEYMSEKYYDVFAYYPAVDRVISGTKDTLSLESYYTVYYETPEENFLEEFREVAECSAGYPVLCSLNRTKEESYLCVSIRVAQSRNSKFEYILVIVLNPRYVSEWLSGMKVHDLNDIFIVMDKDRKPIFCMGASLDSCQIAINEDTLLSQEAIEGKKYFLQMQKSEVIPAYYAYALPYKYFWNKVYKLYLICGLGTIISMILGVFVVRKQTQKVYLPIEQVVENLQQHSEVLYDAQNDTEFEFIQAIFAEKAENESFLNKTIREAEVFKRTNFIYSLLNGSNKNTKEIETIFRENGITLYSDYFCVAMIQVEQMGDVYAGMQSFVVTNVFEELFNREHQGYVIQLRNDRYLLLVNVKDQKEIEGMKALLEEGKKFFEHYFRMTFTIGLSSVQQGIFGIHSAYEEAEVAQKYKFLLGKGSVICYSDIEIRKFKALPAVDVKMSQVVTEWLTDNRQEQSAEQLVSQLMKDYGMDSNASLEMVECFKYETISMLSRVMMQIEIWTDEWKGYVLGLIGKATLVEFRESFADLLMQISRRKQEIADKKDICAYVLNYIQVNYADEQLTLTLLSNITGIDSSYLSKLFKEKYSYTIPEYISKTRIENAKEHLKHTQYSIGEIAEKNGFLNSNSFIRTFKRSEGITPGAYRELWKGETLH